MPRLFVAIDIPDALKTSLSDLCSFGISGVKWVEKDRFHLSLRFIGEVEDNLFRDIAASISKIKSPPFSLRLKGVGTFPQKNNPKVIWAGVTTDEALFQLQKKVENQLNHMGIERDKRKFSPHITLGRVKGKKTGQIANFLQYHSLFSTPSFEVNDFHLFSSQLTPKGPIYRKEETIQLL